MKVAVIGSRGLDIDMVQLYIPAATTEIVSGGAKGVDTMVKNFALENSYKYTEFLPDYEKYGRAAPIRRNDEIIEYADLVVAIWDGKSKGTKYVTEQCKRANKCLIIYRVIEDEMGFDEIDDCEYINMVCLGAEQLKEIVMSELNSEKESDINVELIYEAVDAIVALKHSHNS